MILTNARILTFDRKNTILDSGSVEILPDGGIGAVGPDGSVPGRQEAVDLGGRLLMPALINCHTHLYSTLARGIKLPGKPPKNFKEILEKLWWRLDRALNEEDVYYSALVGLMDSARCGVGTVIDHHSSPNACAGSLDQIARAFGEVGLRGATCYETTDRNGRAAMYAAIQENVRFLERAPAGLVHGAFGLHAAFTLKDATLRRCVEANQPLGGAFHIHVSEDRCDRGAVRRLSAAGILNERTLAAHCVHVDAGERKALGWRRVNVVHNPQSNCNNGVGFPSVPWLIRGRVLVGLGSDGFSPRIWEELKTAYGLQKLRGRPAPGDLLLNNRTIMKKIWGLDLGRVQSGARADLLVLDYFPPTPMDASNLTGHLLLGISNAPVDSLMVNGRWVLREKRFPNLDERRVAEQAAARAKALWDRF